MIVATFGGQLVWPTEEFAGMAVLLRSVVLLLFTLAMVVLMNQRSARLLGEQQRLAQEMRAGAEMQELLLPAG